jgi:hypothetical protein
VFKQALRRLHCIPARQTASIAAIMTTIHTLHAIAETAEVAAAGVRAAGTLATSLAEEAQRTASAAEAGLHAAVQDVHVAIDDVATAASGTLANLVAIGAGVGMQQFARDAQGVFQDATALALPFRDLDVCRKLQSRIQREFSTIAVQDVPVVVRRILELSNAYWPQYVQRSLAGLQYTVREIVTRCGPYASSAHVPDLPLADVVDAAVACVQPLLYIAAPNPTQCPQPFVDTGNFARLEAEVLRAYPGRAPPHSAAQHIFDATARLVVTMQRLPGMTGVAKANAVKHVLEAVVSREPSWATPQLIALACVLAHELADAYKNRCMLRDVAVEATGAIVAHAISSRCWGLCR